MRQLVSYAVRLQRWVSPNDDGLQIGIGGILCSGRAKITVTYTSQCGSSQDAGEPCVDPKSIKSVTVTEKAPKVRDLGAEAQAELIRLQYEAYLRNRQTKRDQPLSPSGQQTIQAIANAAPTTCGGGGFVYAGAAAEKNGVEGFVGYLGEYDSNTGWSNNLPVEAGVHGGPEAPAYARTSGGLAVNRQHSEPLLFAPVAGAGGLVGSPSGAGFYVGTSFVGAGAYVNITTNAACNQIRRGH